MVTEFGIAYLFGKSMRERATALIEIAHPDFRESLLDEAKRQSLVPAAHRLGGGRDYLVEEERVVTLKSGSKVMHQASPWQRRTKHAGHVSSHVVRRRLYALLPARQRTNL